MGTDLDIAVGKRLKTLRENKGESQEKLGTIFHVSQKAISNYEKGITPLPIELQIKYAEHFNVSHDYLCTGRSSDSILKLLEKYVSLNYQSMSNGNNKYLYPVLSINQVYFKYLVRTAKAKSDNYMRDEIRMLSIETEESEFYASNKNNDFSVSESVVPVPQNLIYPDDNKTDWNQNDLLREMNNILLTISAPDKDKGE